MHKSLTLIDRFLNKAFHFALSKSLSVITLTILTFIFFTYQTKNLTQSVTIEDQLDPSMQSSKNLQILKDSFGGNTSLGLIIIPKEKYFFSYEQLCKLQENINTTAHDNSIISDFSSALKLRFALQSKNQLTYQRVIPNPCEHSNTIVSSNPLSPLLSTPWAGILTDKYGRDLTFNFTINPKDPPGFYGEFDSQGIENLMKKIESILPHHFFWSGTQAMQYFTLKGLDQSQWLNYLVIIIIWISLRVYFGTWRAGAIFLLSLFFSSSIIFGGMAIFHHSIDMLSSCLFLILAVASLEDFIFVAQHQLENDCSFIDSHKELTYSKFFYFTYHDIRFWFINNFKSSSNTSFSVFGPQWALLVNGCAMFLLVPTFMNIFPSWRKWVNYKKSFSIIKTKKIISKRPSLIFARMALIIFILSIFSIKNFRFSQTPSEMFPKNHQYQKMIDYVRKIEVGKLEASLFFSHLLISNETQKDIEKNLKKDSIVKT